MILTFNCFMVEYIYFFYIFSIDIYSFSCLIDRYILYKSYYIVVFFWLIVVGNVYNTRFSKRWFDIKDKYSLNYATLFGNPLKFATDVWEPTKHLPIIDNVMANQHVHLTKFQTEKKGGFFDQQPKGPGSDELIPLKNGMDTEKYGGYNKPAATFYVLVKYQKGKKSELSILPIDLLVARK